MKFVGILLSLLMISGFTMTSVNAPAPPFPSLPATTVMVTVNSGVGEYPLIIALSEVPSGYDVGNLTYSGYCANLLTGIYPGTPFPAMLISSLDLPTAWNKINWILNQGGLAVDTQVAIWLTLGFNSTQILTNAGLNTSAAAITLFNNADGGFTPAAGQIVSVLCEVEGAQDCLIELTVPQEHGSEGLTPGFWKNHQDLWVGCDPSDSFNDIFNVSISIDGNSDPSLIDALNAKGGVNEEKGVYDALARHAVAALLNAAHPDVDYPLTISEIIDMVHDAIINGGAEDVKDTLETNNQLGGGIDAHGNPI